MTYKVISPPSVEPVSIEEARAQCRYSTTDNDAVLSSMIVAARELAEHETARALCTQTRELVLDAFPEAFVLRGAPIQSVVSVKYLDADGNEQTLDPQDTLLDKDSEPGYLVPVYGKAWPASYPVPNAVRVRYVCGYGNANDVPESIKRWMLLAISAFDAQREAIGPSQTFALPDRFWHRMLDYFRIYEAV